jgi:hypothetical protein
LRPVARLASTWRARIAYGLVFGLVTAWAAAAPQAGLSLGERLRLSFNALLFVCLGLAATSGLRRSAGILDDADVQFSRRNRFAARLLSICAKSAQDIIPALPFFLLLAALQIISPIELITSLTIIAVVLIAASATSNVKLTVLSILTMAVMFLTWRKNSFERSVAALLAIHLALKAFILWAAIVQTHRLKKNLMHESITSLDAAEFPAIHRNKLRRAFAPAVIALACINILFVCALVFGVKAPATFEQKFALSLALAGGAILLFLDASALVWRGLLSGVTTTNVHHSFATLFATIIGIPWAVAWIFSALHSGEAVTLNEVAAYFFLWIALGAAISWFARTTAKDKMQRDLRRLLAEQ